MLPTILRDKEVYKEMKRQNLVLEPKQIIDVVCKTFGYTYDEVNIELREKDIVETRYANYYFLYKYTYFGLKRIGKEFGDRDHSTIINGIQKHLDNFDRRDVKSMKIMRRNHAIEQKISKMLQRITHEEATEKAIGEVYPGVTYDLFFDNMVCSIESSVVKDIMKRAFEIFDAN